MSEPLAASGAFAWWTCPKCADLIPFADPTAASFLIELHRRDHRLTEQAELIAAQRLCIALLARDVEEARTARAHEVAGMHMKILLNADHIEVH